MGALFRSSIDVSSLLKKEFDNFHMTYARSLCKSISIIVIVITVIVIVEYSAMLKEELDQLNISS